MFRYHLLLGLRSLDEGQKVSFDTAEERGKVAANNLKPL